ncbi:unnamed protein product [Haemonchus placei]|uniref:Uncharacterized protein n=1 Tax=Haemonchus placei TaxID=6290 RepID=A0A0N4WV64_HAEPC|nr:unnamed protein product [Haemonchus placei]
MTSEQQLPVYFDFVVARSTSIRGHHGEPTTPFRSSRRGSIHSQSIVLEYHSQR